MAWHSHSLFCRLSAERYPVLGEYYALLKDRPSIKASWPPHWLENTKGQDTLKEFWGSHTVLDRFYGNILTDRLCSVCQMCVFLLLTMKRLWLPVCCCNSRNGSFIFVKLTLRFSLFKVYYRHVPAISFVFFFFLKLAGKHRLVGFTGRQHKNVDLVILQWQLHAIAIFVSDIHGLYM